MIRNEVTPRPASEDDLDQVTAIEAYSNRPAWTKAAFSAELSKKHSNFWVLTDDETDNIVHAFVVFSFPSEQAHVQTLAVSKTSRRKGYAALLMRAVINYILRKGGESVVLEVRKSNAAAIALYQQLGFVIIHTTKKFYPDGEDAYSLIFRNNKEAIPESDDEEEIPDGKPENIN